MRKNVVIKTLILSISIILVILLILYLWKTDTDMYIYSIPDYHQTDITQILKKENLTDNDYTFIYLQTGLSRISVDKLIRMEDYDKIYKIQERLFKTIDVECMKNSIISWEERIVHNSDKIIFSYFEAGDILITPCSHTFGWRNGHAAIVIDEKNGNTLESVVLGQKSSIQSIKKWQNYPCVMVLRLKNTSKEKRKEIASFAKENCTNINYGFDMGFLSPKFNAEQLDRTHCSHLVWYAYKKYGYDLDSDGGIIVTPKDISNSPLLEIVQVTGLNPTKKVY